MAIQRAAPMPVPSDEATRIRAALGPFGAEVWEGEGRRVLLIRVPREDPDPVNDLEAAVEHLSPGDVEDLTHCILLGDRRAAQVYVRPLQDLMRERVAADARQTAHWRQQMPPQLGHVLFQSPEDPHRAWRLAIRVPCRSIEDVDEDMLGDLADGLGPELDTPRFKQLLATYLIASEDDVRLDGQVFREEVRKTWEDEERQREKERQAREAEESARREQEARRRREEEDRKAFIREMDRKLARHKAEQAMRAVPEEAVRDLLDTDRVRAPRSPDGSGTGAPGRGSTPSAADSAARGRGSAPSAGDWAASGRGPGASGAGLGGEAGPERGEPLLEAETVFGGHSADAVLDRAQHDGMPEADEPLDSIEDLPAAGERQQDDINARVEALRARVDDVLETPIDRSTAGAAGAGRMQQESGTSGQGRPTGAGRSSQPSHSTGPSRLSQPSRPTDPKGRLAAHLEEAGFDVLRDPPTAGHTIDLAAERPDGDPQRIVARVVRRLDIGVARALLKTARELDVDLVLCIAEHTDEPARKLLVATPVKVAAPRDIEAYNF